MNLASFHNKAVVVCVLFVLSCALFACNSNNNNDNLTLDSFCKNIWNIKKDSREFSYLSSKPSLVLFYDGQKPSCDIIPTIDSLKANYGKSINFHKVNADEEQALCNSLKISVLPTCIIFSQNSKPFVIEGEITQREFQQILKTRQF